MSSEQRMTTRKSFPVKKLGYDDGLEFDVLISNAVRIRLKKNKDTKGSTKDWNGILWDFMYERAVQVVQEARENGDEEISDDTAMTIDLNKRIEANRRKAYRAEKFHEWLKTATADEVAELAAAHNKTVDQLFSEYDTLVEKTAKSKQERYEAYLVNLLRAGAKKTKTIKQAMIEDGILDNTDEKTLETDWAAVRQAVKRSELFDCTFGEWALKITRKMEWMVAESEL